LEGFALKKLILVEGLPGTGKTTISKWLSTLLIEKGESVILLNEGDENIPCDFYEIAGIPKSDFELLCSNHPLEREWLINAGSHTKNYAFLRIDKCPSHIAEKIKRWDMGDASNKMITVTDYITCALERLQNWVDNNIYNSETVIIDSGYLQNPINELLLRHATNSDILEFINAITDMITPLNPVCIYLRRDSAEQAITFARMAKGVGWSDRVDKLLKEAGCENLFEQRFELELELLQNIESLICHICGDNWDNAKKTIRGVFI